MPIISITFYMVIIRISMTKGTSQASEEPSSALNNSVTWPNRTRTTYPDQQQYPMKKMEVHITHLTEHDFEPDKPRVPGDVNSPDMPPSNSVAKFDTAFGG